MHKFGNHARHAHCAYEEDDMKKPNSTELYTEKWWVGIREIAIYKSKIKLWGVNG